MAIEVRISGTTYKAADDFLIKQQAGAVSMSTVSVLKGSNPIPQPLQSAQILIDGAPVFYGLIATVQDPRRSTGYEPARYTIEIQSIEAILNFRMVKRNWYNKRVDEIVNDIFNDYLAEEGLTLGGISTTTVQIGAYRKTYSKVSEILDELAEKVGRTSYFISPEKKFYFLTRDEFPAIEAPDRVTNMSRSRAYGDLRSVQVVKGSTQSITGIHTNEVLRAGIAALSGTSGKIENIKSDATIRNPDAATLEAEALAANYAENEQTITCEIEGISGSSLYTLWRITPSRIINGQTVSTKWPAEYAGEYVVIERTISGAGGKVQTSLTLRNRNYFARYGYSLRKFEKAIAEVDEALTDIDISMSRTFFDQPIGPYKRGDLWIHDGALYQATTDRPAGVFFTADWVWSIRANVTVLIESTNGDKFRPGQSTSTTLIGRAFKNGVEITGTIPDSLFRWTRRSFFTPNDDAVWNANHQSGYKSVEVTTDSINARATYTLEILE